MRNLVNNRFKERSPARKNKEPMNRFVLCKKLNRELPGLDFYPFDDELGEKIYHHISAEAWQLWLEYSKKLINEYRLDLVSEKSFLFLHDQCALFLFDPSSPEEQG